MARLRARLDQGTQARKAGTVADQDQRPPVFGRMEAAIGADAQRDRRALACEFCQPARGETKPPIGMTCLLYTSDAADE